MHEEQFLWEKNLGMSQTEEELRAMEVENAIQSSSWQATGHHGKHSVSVHGSRQEPDLRDEESQGGSQASC